MRDRQNMNSCLTTLVPSTNTERFNKRVTNVVCVIAAILLCAVAVCLVQTPAFAAGEAIVKGVSDAGEEVWSIARNIAVIIAIIVVIAAGLEFILGGQRGGEVAKKLIIGTVAGLAIVLLAPYLVSFFAGIFKSSSDWVTVDFSTN